MNKKLLIIYLVLFIFILSSTYSSDYRDLNTKTKFHLDFDRDTKISDFVHRELVSNLSYTISTGSPASYHPNGVNNESRNTQQSTDYIHFNFADFNIGTEDYTLIYSYNTNYYLSSGLHVLDFAGSNIYVYWDTNEQFRFYHNTDYLLSDTFTLSQTIEWYTFAFVKKNNTLSLYHDGELVINTTFGSLADVGNATLITIGNNNGHTAGLGARYDETLFITEALSEEEIKFFSCNSENPFLEECTPSQQYPYCMISVFSNNTMYYTNQTNLSLDWTVYAPQLDNGTDNLTCDLYINDLINQSFVFSDKLNYFKTNLNFDGALNGNNSFQMSCNDTYWECDSYEEIIEIDLEVVNCTESWQPQYDSCLINDSQLKYYIDSNACGTIDDLPFDNGTYTGCNYTSNCTESWLPQYDSCLINDSQLKYYTDDNTCNTTDNLPFDNGTYVGCNYCFEDIDFVEEICVYNGTGYYNSEYYQDNNYYSCCTVTSIMADCSIEYSPYNESTTTLCVEALEQFELEMDENVFLTAFFEDKVHSTIWLNDTTEVYTCQSYVKTIDPDGIISEQTIQINPAYQKKEQTLISLSSKSYEDREFFYSNKGMATVYYTKENLIFDNRPYLFGVECTGNTTKTLLRSEKVVYLKYKHVNAPITRLVWAKENLVFIILGLILLSIFMSVLVIIIKNVRGR